MKYLVKSGDKRLENVREWIKVVEKNNGDVEYQLDVMKLSEHIKNNTHFIYIKDEAGVNGFTYIYQQGYYQICDDQEMMAFIKRFIPQKLINSKDIREILFDLKTETRFVDVNELNNDENIINFQDGILHLDTMELTKHSPEILTTIQIPAKYEDIKNAPEEAPVFDNYLNTLTSGEEAVKKIILKCLGLSISNIYGYRTKKALFLTGKGDTGKSQIKKIAETLVGAKNISNVDLKVLNKDERGIARLYQKRLCGCNDMAFSRINDMNNFKMATGGDSMDCKFLYKESVNFIFRGFLWFNCNRLPYFGGDLGNWVYDRILAINCTNVIPEEKRDKELCNKMLREKNTIIKKSLIELKDLINDNFNFKEPDSVKGTRARYQESNSTLYMFVSNFCEILDDDVKPIRRMKRSDFNEAYSIYINKFHQGKGKVSGPTMESMIRDKYGEPFIKSNGYWYMRNITLSIEGRNELKDYGYYEK